MPSAPAPDAAWFGFIVISKCHQHGILPVRPKPRVVRRHRPTDKQRPLTPPNKTCMYIYLVGGADDAADPVALVEGVERHDGDGRGAVGVGDEPVRGLDGAGVDFGDHQGDVVIVAEGGGVVDHVGPAVLGDLRRVLQREGARHGCGVCVWGALSID